MLVPRDIVPRNRGSSAGKSRTAATGALPDTAPHLVAICIISGVPTTADPRPEPTTWEWTLPYAGWCSCLGSWALALLAIDLSATPSRFGPIVYVLSWVAGAMGVAALMSLWIVAGRRGSASGRLAVGVSGAVVVLVWAGAAWMMPPLPQTAFQQSLQEVVDRRGRTATERFRGIDVRMRTNSLGWADDEFDSDTRQAVAFVGDSFLELRSTRNLAELVEVHLGDRDVDLDILNLSRAGSGPIEYRHRFFEVALPLRPAGVVMFVYSLNDLEPGYRFEAYEHPTYYVTGDAVALAREVSAAFAAPMQHLADAHEPLYSQRDLVDQLPPRPDRQLAYFAALASSRAPVGPSWMTDLIHRTGSGLYAGMRHLRASWRERGGMHGHAH